MEILLLSITCALIIGTIAGFLFGKRGTTAAEQRNAALQQQLTDLQVERGSLQVENRLLAERIHKAAVYFAERLDELLKPLIERTRLDSDNQEIKQRITEAVYALQQSFAQKRHLLARVIAHGFSVTSYLKDKAVGMLNAEQPAKRERKSKATEKIEVDRNSDIKHPKLFRNLRTWRAARAEELGRPVYGVLTQKALIGIVNELPTSGKELLRMPGFGKKSLEMFGKEILAIVQEYIEDNPLM